MYEISPKSQRLQMLPTREPNSKQLNQNCKLILITSGEGVETTVWPTLSTLMSPSSATLVSRGSGTCNTLARASTPLY